VNRCQVLDAGKDEEDAALATEKHKHGAPDELRIRETRRRVRASFPEPKLACSEQTRTWRTDYQGSIEGADTVISSA
jgi:hypothetical protein